MDLVVVGGAGYIGSAVLRTASQAGRKVIALDRSPEESARGDGPLSPLAEYRALDLVRDPIPNLPEGRVILAHGLSLPQVAHPWELVAANAWTTARLVPQLSGRSVTLISSVEVYGSGDDSLRASSDINLPCSDSFLVDAAGHLVARAMERPTEREMIPTFQELLGVDPSGRWHYAISKRVQELMLLSLVQTKRLDIVRVANVFGPGQDRVIARLARRLRYGLPTTVRDCTRTFVSVDDLAEAVLMGIGPPILNAGTGLLPLPELAHFIADVLDVEPQIEVLPRGSADSSGAVDIRDFIRRLGRGGEVRLKSQIADYVKNLQIDPLTPLRNPISVVTPARPERPQVVLDRIYAALDSGVLKSGGPNTSRLQAELRERLHVPDDLSVLLTSSGSAALRLAIVAVSGMAKPGEAVLLPSFTFAATGEIPAQLGYQLRFCDIDSQTWNLDPRAVADMLATDPSIKVVVAVDALGNPADYDALNQVCRDAGVPLVADSAPAFGSRLAGRPIGTQADVHAFSMSFAKPVSAAGGGGFMVVPNVLTSRLTHPIDWTRSAQLGEVHAAVALDQIRDLDRLIRRRQQVAEIYADLVRARPRVIPQTPTPGAEPSWTHWSARFGGVDRKRFIKELERLGVMAKPYYAPPLHHTDWTMGEKPRPRLPVTDWLSQQVISLPMSSEMSTADADAVLWRVLYALDQTELQSATA